MSKARCYWETEGKATIGRGDGMELLTLVI